MNILPHKSWHVRTKKNIERVRRDEAKAADEEKERQRKIALAEQEARTDLLRKRARDKDGTAIEDSANKRRRIEETPGNSSLAEPSGDRLVAPGSSSIAETSRDLYTATGHINFFKELEAGEEKQGTNKDHEAEKAAEKEKWEKDIGLLTYLGQSAVETQEKTPWYLAKRKELTKEEKFDVKDRKLKESHDPLRQMSSYLHTKHKHTDRHKDSSHTKKHKKKKNKDKEKHRKSSSSSKTIEQLRAERLKREQMERQKVRDMFSGQGSKVKDIEEPISERDRGYNSQFNPEFVRKPKRKRPHEFTDRY
ncbi:leukocyte receptor cluster member 1 homolog [Mya arenaria]|uniref:leukocyte receptor cluster member 1 homolog n=1 Tax=Mya arenaria TaxID=6604 RepID=UPI0022E36883|nr:leukocyte receptor cluster member 1 homolog [Mya arenaria]